MMIARSLGTHDGTFHADEVTASALLLNYNLIDKDKIIRSRDAQELGRCEFVCDVGGKYLPDQKKFDHHQVSYQGNLSSAGMIWLFFKEQKIISEEIYCFLNQSLIQGVDAHDNGVSKAEPGVCTFSHVISGFVPSHYNSSKEEMNRAFLSAVEFVQGHIHRSIERFTYIQDCREKVKDAMQKSDTILSFSEAMPWIDLFFEMGGEKHPAQFVVMPSGSHWKLRGIPPKSDDRMKVRWPLPKDWAGLLEKDLQKTSSIPGAIFCHKGRFIAVFETKEDVDLALKWIMGRPKEKE